jgi:quercetin dioxygenase-like cupin family protein
MREIRTFELDHGEPAAAWRVTQALTLQVMAGEVWLTVQGDLRDYWLSAGETFELNRGERAWVSAGPGGARLALAFGRGTHAAQVRSAAKCPRPSSVWSLVPRWLQTI